MLEVDERGQHLQSVLVECLGIRAAHELDGLGLEVVVNGLQFLENLLNILILLVVEEDWKTKFLMTIDYVVDLEIMVNHAMIQQIFAVELLQIIMKWSLVFLSLLSI